MSVPPQNQISAIRYKNKEKTLNQKYDTVSNPNFHNSVRPASFLPPLPPLPQFKDNLILAPPMTQATLNRLEVESTSTKSLPISFPYYFLDQEDPQDTFHLWRTDTESVVKSTKDKELPEPPLKNSNNQQQQQQQSHLESKNNNQNMVKTYNEFNPKRFSHFIVDEQNPYVSQRLDNLSVVSPSLESAGYEIIRSLTPMQKNTKTSALILNPERNLGGSAEVLNNTQRDISDSMGSQATIFSTRPEQDSPLLSRNENSRKKRAAKVLFKRKAKRTSNVIVPMSSSTNSSLARKNAIKSKQGSWFYRLKLSLKKMISKFKFYSFKVSTKRTASVKRSRTIQSLRRRRRRRENPQPKDIKRIKSIRVGSSPFNISAPITNPQLGKQPVFKVAKIDDSLKFRAGAPKENVNLVDYDEAFGKMNHLSEYIYQQETEYFKKHGVKKNDNVASPEILGESKSMLPSPNFDDSPSELLTDSVTTHAKTMPPIPPPHLDHSFASNQRDQSPKRIPVPEPTSPPPEQQQQKQNIVELWEEYLRLVLYKRIQLRQEINMFQNFMVSEFTPNTNKRQHSTRSVSKSQGGLFVPDKHEQSIANSSTINGSSIYTDSNTLELVKSMECEKLVVKSNSAGGSTNAESRGDNASVYTSSSLESSSMINDKDEEFNTRVLHRRSMLGEMLEYLSEDDVQDEDYYDDNNDSDVNDEDDHSIQKSNSIVSKQSDIILKKYGTVVRRNSSRLNSPLKRSFGLNHSLSSIANE